MDFEEGNLSLSGEAKIRNPRIEIPNVGPETTYNMYELLIKVLITYPIKTTMNDFVIFSS